MNPSSTGHRERARKPQGEKGREPVRAPATRSPVPRHPPDGMRFAQQALGNQGILRRLQAKPEINQSGDIYEQEADRVADVVMSTPNQESGAAVRGRHGNAPAKIQRKCATCEREDEEPRIQRKESSTAQRAVAGPAVTNALGSPGQPLDRSTRTFMESRFGHDFGAVRVHTDAGAGESARQINARAYTVGHDVVFNSGQFAPETANGKRLLAHELVHVVQQRGVCNTATGKQPRQVDHERDGASTYPGSTKPPITPAPRHVARKPDETQPSPPDCLLVFERNVVQINCDGRTLVELTAGDSGAAVTLKEERGPGYVRFTYPSRNRPQEFWLPRRREVWGGFQPGTRPPTTLSGAKITVQPTTVDLNWSVTIARPGVSAPSPSPERFTEAPSGTGPTAQAQGGRGTTLEAALEQIRKIPIVLTAENKALKVAEAVVGLDLSDRNNLNAVINTIARSFGPDSARVLSLFLTALERTMRAQQPSAANVPTPQEAARMQSQIGLLQVQPRGPYKQVGPGVLLPVLSQPARPLAYALEGASGFIDGLVEGLTSSVSEEQVKQLVTKLGESALLNVAFPPVFASGAAVGIVEDVIDTVKEIYRTLSNLPEMVNGFVELLQALFSPESRDVAKKFGREIGQDYGQKVVALLQGNIFEFTFNLGRMIGPTIVYTALTLVGAPEFIAASFVERLLPILRELLNKFPRLLQIVEALSARVISAGKGTAIARELAASKDAAAAERLAKEALALRTAGTEVQAAEGLSIEAKFVTEHPPKDIRGEPGHRHASVGEGHEVVEVRDPQTGGIHCEFHSLGPFPKVPCPPGMGEERILLSEEAYRQALENVFPSQFANQLARTVDGIGQQAARRAVANPQFVAAVNNGNWTLAGTLFHSAAAQEARALSASAIPTGWVVEAERTLQAGAGGGRADLLLRGPAGEIVEFDWKTSGRSALSYGSRSEMTRHVGQITTNIGGTLTTQESRSWIDYVRPLMPGASWPR